MANLGFVGLGVMGGEMVKRIGTEARLELEAALGVKVFLDLHVGVCGGERTTPVGCWYTADHYASFRRIVP